MLIYIVKRQRGNFLVLLKAQFELIYSKDKHF